MADELLGYRLSPSGLGWSGTRKFLLEFWFLHNIRASTNVYKMRYGRPRRRPRRDVGANERDFAKCPCTNKANCRRSFKRNVSSLKSESQAWAGGVTNGAVIRACRAKQTQFATDRPQEALAARTATVATRGGKSAKQTQLAAERREGQVLYGQRVMVNWTRKGLRRNKANSRRCHGGRDLSGRRRGQSRKTKPILGNRGDEGRGLSCKTNPICRSRQRAGVGRLCGTNPISPVGQGPGGRNARNKPDSSIADWGQPCHGTPALRLAASGPRGPIVRNKPNSVGSNVQNEPNFRQGHACETNPISGNRPNRGVGCTNKANSPRANRDGRWPAGPDVLCHRGQPCETNPISRRGRAGRGLGDAGRGVWYKQTQFLPLCRSGDRRSREGKSCETKPIPGGQDIPSFQYSIIPPFQSDGDCAKRSQFRTRQADPMDLESATACRPHPSLTAGGGKIDWLQFRRYNSLNMPGNHVERPTERRIVQ